MRRPWISAGVVGPVLSRLIRCRAQPAPASVREPGEGRRGGDRTRDGDTRYANDAGPDQPGLPVHVVVEARRQARARGLRERDQTLTHPLSEAPGHRKSDGPVAFPAARTARGKEVRTWNGSGL